MSPKGPSGSGLTCCSGNFADELGEDFLGLRDLGVAQEHGMSSLTVPSSLFYGRKKRAVDAGHLGCVASTCGLLFPLDHEAALLQPTSLTRHYFRGKANQPDYPPPPPFIPLNQNTLHTHLPALLHSFFAQRLESGLGLADDPAFDAAHTQIGSLGQIVSKTGPSVAKKKKEVEEKKVVKEKKPAKKGP
jgi:transcriptional activator SPT7